MKFLHQAWIANDGYDWLFAASLAVLVLLALALARSILRRVLAVVSARAGSGFDDIVVRVIDGTKLWLLTPVALYAGMAILDVPRKLAHVVGVITVIALIAQAAVWLNRFVAAWIKRQIERRTADGETVTALSMISFAAQILVWVVAVMLVLDQLAFDITAL